MIAYKGFNRHDDGTLSCHGFVYETGKTYKHEGKVLLCRSGFHACHELHKTWQFYPNNGNNVFYEVECGGEIIESKADDGKFVCSEIRLVKKIDMTDVAKFDDVGYSFEGFAAVGLDGKWNFIDTKGKLLSEQWYDWTANFHEGFARVELNNKFNHVDTKGKLLSEQWYDWVGDFSEGFAVIELNRKWNHIDTSVKLLSEQWYDWAYQFYEGFALVELNGKYNFINTDGKLLSEQWYDDAWDFCDGFAHVELDGKWHQIDTDGKIVE